MVKRVYIVGKVRGFFKHLIGFDKDIEFLFENDIYERSSNFKIYISKILKSKLIGFFGIFQVINAFEKYADADYYLSFNRFLKSDKSYVIYLENPTALCNYSLSCLNSPFVKSKLIKKINDDKLKKIVCMNKACFNTLENVIGVSIPNDKVVQIYPLVEENKLVNNDVIHSRCYNSKIKLLYIAQGVRFFSKGGLEVLEAYKKLKNKKYSVELTIISNAKNLDKNTIDLIRTYNVNFVEANLTFEEMQEIFMKHTILLHPSSDDSFPLTVLEAIKSGLPAIVSDLYGLKELVVDEYNGFYVTPTYRYFDEENLPNKYIWKNADKIFNSKVVNESLVNELITFFEILYKDRDLLYRMSNNSINLSMERFNDKKIIEQWKNVVI